MTSRSQNDFPDPVLAVPQPFSPCTCINLRRASRAITEFYDRVLEPSGLTVTQYALLRAVSRAGGVSLTDLAERVALDRTTLSRNLAALTRRDLVRVGPGADRRARQAGLTPAGEGALKRALPLWRKAQARVRQRLGAAGLDRLDAVLARIHPLAHRPANPAGGRRP